MARSEAMDQLSRLVGDWDLTLTNAWFLDSLGVEQHGRATFQWLGDAFVIMDSELDGEPVWDLVFGHNTAYERYEVLYHDSRGVDRHFVMSFTDTEWTMLREDPDFHQRFVARLEDDRILGAWEMSEDRGATWRTDFDLRFERRT
ncbi:MAG TPA: hypothetical protein VHF25_14635 [Nitriliruptorales bacterium]|nr:hypothetical protein [Nitriliruptorales bacterium]